jgi:hypothetical protein
MTVHGRLVQFTDEASLRDGLCRLRAQGYTRIEVFSPYPLDDVHGTAERAGRWIPRIMFGAGVVGGAGMLAIQYLSAVVDYPVDAGGRPHASWPAFVPSAIEVTILFAVVAGFIAFLAGSGLPALYHPVFDVAWFEEASRDGFLLWLRADDPLWESRRGEDDIAALQPLRHAEVHA